MAEKTDIEWCDSTLNLMMGCDGCELWNPTAEIRHCYAGTLTDRYAGLKGWPDAFEKPKLFLERLDKALKWPDLAGKKRPDKPWLNDHPRMIFLNDMGDTFTESLPLDWLAPLLPRMADSPHVYMILTKRAKRLLEFSKAHPLPPNVWPGVSVTTQRTAGRILSLLEVTNGGVKWVSVEPILSAVFLTLIAFPDGSGARNALTGQFRLKATGVNGNPDFEVETELPNPARLGLVIGGGESGSDSRLCELDWLRSLRNQCRSAKVPYFLKQVGSNPTHGVNDGFPHRIGNVGQPLTVGDGFGRYSVTLIDRKGGDPQEWPEDLRVREFPKEQ